MAMAVGMLVPGTRSTGPPAQPATAAPARASGNDRPVATKATGTFGENEAALMAAAVS